MINVANKLTNKAQIKDLAIIDYSYGFCVSLTNSSILMNSTSECQRFILILISDVANELINKFKIMINYNYNKSNSLFQLLFVHLLFYYIII